MRALHLRAGTRDERHFVTSRVLDAIGRVGVIDDARQRSNKEIAVRFTVAQGRVEAFRAELERLPVRLTDASAAELAALTGNDEVHGWLTVSFFHDEPDLRVPVPAVPG